MEQKRRSQEQMQRAKRKEAEFYKEKSRYFGITITDKDLVISVLDSLEAFQAEGNACIIVSSNANTMPRRTA